MKKHFRFLKDAYFFKSLSDEDIARIQKACKEEKFNAGEVVFFEGTAGDRCFIILEGSVEIWKEYLSPDRDLLSVYEAGQLFGELALIDDSPRGATVIVREPVKLLSINREDFNKVLSGSATISNSILKAITATIREQTEHFLDNLRVSKRRLEKAYAQLKEEIEERKQLEKQLLQAQKMESIGTLARGIAHDFNNILFVISGYTQLSLEKIPEEDSCRSNLLEVLSAVERARELTGQILTFSRQSTPEKRPIQIQKIAKEVIKMMTSSVNSEIEINQKINKNCRAVMADPTQIHQVLMNLCTNAYHAMQPHGGILEVSLDEIRVSSTDQSEYPANMPAGLYARLSVKDTGCGMDHEVMKQIFDPYFTTKKKGEGTGLGLSIVHGIVKSHGGYISVNSEQEKGSTFHIYLPLLVSKPSSSQKTFEEPAPTGEECVLVVEDEHQAAKMVHEMLTSLGYKAEYRVNSMEALRAFEANLNKFDLVITDSLMPDMSGFELAQALIHARPDIPIILCAGFSEIIPDEKMNASGIREVIMKPIVKNALAKSIRKVLDAPPTEKVLRETK